MSQQQFFHLIFYVSTYERSSPVEDGIYNFTLRRRVSHTRSVSPRGLYPYRLRSAVLYSTGPENLWDHCCSVIEAQECFIQENNASVFVRKYEEESFLRWKRNISSNSKLYTS